MWLDHDDDYERINAMAGILPADPDRSEFLPDLWEALNDECSMEQDVVADIVPVALLAFFVFNSPKQRTSVG